MTVPNDSPIRGLVNVRKLELPREPEPPWPCDLDDAPTPLPPLKILEPERLEDVPLPVVSWIVAGAMPAGAVTTLSGHGETGKSYLGLQAGVARALGIDWLGFPTQPGRTVFVSCEDSSDQVHIRLDSILNHYGARFPDLGDRLRVIDRSEEFSAIMRWPDRRADGRVTGFYRQILDYAVAHRASLTVLDSRYNFFDGEQNDTAQVHAFMGALRAMAVKTAGAVLLLSHPSRNGLESGDGESGSVAWHNTVRSRLYLRTADPERDGEGDRVLEHLKSNWGPKADPLPLRWRDGAFEALRPETGTFANIEMHRAQRTFMEALAKLSERGMNMSASPAANNFAPTVMVKSGFGARATKKQLWGAMEALLESGRIVIEAYGRPGDERRRIVATKP